MSRSCRSCFRAAIQAQLNGPRPRGAQDEWGRDGARAQCVGLLVNRRTLHPDDLRQTRFRNLSLRHEADCGRAAVTQLGVSRALRRTRPFIDTVLGRDVSGS